MATGATTMTKGGESSSVSSPVIGVYGQTKLDITMTQKMIAACSGSLLTSVVGELIKA